MPPAQHTTPAVDLPGSTDVPLDDAAAAANVAPQNSLDPAVEAEIDQFAAVYPFPLDEFQREAIRTLLHNDSVMVAAPTGSGKALASTTSVLTPTGWQRIADLQIGDAVIGANGEPVTVRGVYPQGIRPAYRVTFSDGVSAVCDQEHLWAVNTKSRRHEGLPWRVLTLNQIMAEGLADGIGWRHFIPMAKPADLALLPYSISIEDEDSLVIARKATGLTQRGLATKLGVSQAYIASRETGRRAATLEWRRTTEAVLAEVGPRPRLDAYVLGLLLGDGGFSTYTVRFSSADEEILDVMRALLPHDAALVRTRGSKYDWQILSDPPRRRNQVIISLQALGLWGKRSEHKFVPDVYKFSSISERISLLQGLLDSDGSANVDGYIEYSTSSELLAADVAFLVRSLGGRTRIKPKPTPRQLSYRLHITLPADIEPFRLTRKAIRYGRRPRKPPTRAITAIEPCGETEMVCISVDAPDGLFVIDGFIVTHNTVVAEYGVYEAFKGTGRVLYTTPIKALSNQKFRDLRALYGNEVGLLTGDVTENREARVLVMTTEILRNMLLQSPWELDDVECVIFDEIHYLADPERGTTWEESIILCPEHIQLICLSATVSNADEIAGWIARTHRPIRLITHNRRPVPLALYYFHDDELSEVVDHHGALVRDFPHTGGEARRQTGRGPSRRRGGERQVPVMDEPQPHELVDALHDKDLLPAIYFLFSRNDCQAYAERLAAMRPHLVRAGQATAIELILQSYLDNLRPEDRELEQVQLITRLAHRGVGFHHAGLLPVLKQLVEVLFSRGLMQVVFATDTLALGVNMPARTVVVGRMSKWDGRRRRILIPNEFQQMAGRAGRRGMDRFGHVVVPYSPWFTFRETLEVATGTLHPVQSAFAIRYNTVLNLWDPPRGERVRQMLQRSLAQYQTSQRVRLLERDVVEIGADIAGVPPGCLIGFDDGDDLLEEYEALGRSLEAARKTERRLRDELREVRAETDGARPWTEPGRPLLRRVLRDAPAGLVVHTGEWGWSICVGRDGGGGIGRFLFREGDRIRLLSEYRQIDYLPDAHVPLPEPLIEPPPNVEVATELVEGETLAALWRAVDVLGLPDLEARAADHRQRARERAAGRIATLEQELAARTEQTRDYTATRSAHPCHTCPVRKEHRDNLRHVDALERERNQLSEALARATDAEEVRTRGIIRGIRDVLHRFGYVRQGFPTPKADMLAEVFDNDGLILCELVDRGVLDRLAPDELAEVFSWFSFDRDFRYANHFTLTERLLFARQRLEDIEHEVLSEERDHGLFISEGHNPTFYGAALAWSRGRSMVEIGEQIELSEGDLVLTFNKTIDLMRQVREMLAGVLPDHPLRGNLAQAERRLRRGIVEQSLTLGFTSFAPVEEAPLDDDEQADDETLGDTDLHAG